MIRTIHYISDSPKAARILKKNEKVLYKGNFFLVEKDGKGREYIPYENVLYVCTEEALNQYSVCFSTPSTVLYKTKIMFKGHPSLEIKAPYISNVHGLYFICWISNSVQRELWIPTTNVITIEQTKIDHKEKKTTPTLGTNKKGKTPVEEKSTKRIENEPVEIILSLTSCEGCPYFHSEREYTADSWENLYIWKCKDQRNRRIGGVETFDPKPPIPTWCKKRVKK